MTIQLDSTACKSSSSMKATKIPKFNAILRLIGYIIVIPSVLGVAISVVMLFTMGQATSEVMTADPSGAAAAGAALGATVGFGFALFFGAVSLVSGVVGWILLMKKKVFKCLKCGFILDRA